MSSRLSSATYHFFSCIKITYEWLDSVSSFLMMMYCCWIVITLGILCAPITTNLKFFIFSSPLLLCCSFAFSESSCAVLLCLGLRSWAIPIGLNLCLTYILHLPDYLLQVIGPYEYTYVITDIAAFILLTVYEGVTNRHAIESMHVYTRC